MDAIAPGVGPASPIQLPHCRVVWNPIEREVGVGVANGDESGRVCVQRVAVIEAVANRAFEQVHGEVRGAETVLDAVKVLRDPRVIISWTIAAVAQAAAMRAGIPVPMARLIGDAAGKLGQRLLDGESGWSQGRAVRYLDFDYDTQARKPRPEAPAIRDAGLTSRDDATRKLLRSYDRGRQTRTSRVTPSSPSRSRGTRQQPASRLDQSRDAGSVQREGPGPRSAPRASPGRSRPPLITGRVMRSSSGRRDPGAAGTADPHDEAGRAGPAPARKLTFVDDPY